MRGAPSWDDRDRGQGRADDGRNQAPTRVSIVDPLELWAHRFPVAGRIQRVAKRGWRLPFPRSTGPPWTAVPGGDRETVPVTMSADTRVGERGVMGAPRSHKRRGPPPVGPQPGAGAADLTVPMKTREEAAPHSDAQDHPYSGRPPRRPSRRSRRAGSGATRTAVRRVQGDRGPCPRRE